MTLYEPTTGAKRPSVKLTDLKDGVILAAAHINREIQDTDYDSGEPLVWHERRPTKLSDVPEPLRHDADPVNKLAITGIIAGTSGKAVGRMGGEDVELVEGMEASIYANGGKNSDWSRFDDAVKANGGIDYGDMIKYWFDREEPASNPKYNDRKIREFSVKAPDPEQESKFGDKCRDLRRAMDEPMPPISVGAPPSVSDTEDLSDPF